MSERVLVMLPVSPWSERARWALDHHGLAYRRVVHVPFLGERRLRKIVGPTPERATTPVLLDGTERFTSSTDIARHTDRIGSGAPLFPPGRDADVSAWVTLADETSNVGRILVTHALLASDAALDETLPPAMPAPLRVLLRPVTRHATRWFARKYALTLDPPALQAAESNVRRTLDAIRAGLDKSAPYLLGTFSYADIVAALVLQGVQPVVHPKLTIGPATRAAFTRPALAAAYPDLLAWRDELYARHRVPASQKR